MDALKDIVSWGGRYRTTRSQNSKNAAREAIQAGAGAILEVEYIPGRQVQGEDYSRQIKPKVRYLLQQVTSSGPRKLASDTLVIGGRGGKDSDEDLSIKDELAAVIISKLVPCKIKSIKKGEEPKIIVTVSNRTGTPIDGVTLAESGAKLSSERTEIKPRETKDLEIPVGNSKVQIAKAKFVAISFVHDGDDKADDDEKDDGEKDVDAEEDEGKEDGGGEDEE